MFEVMTSAFCLTPDLRSGNQTLNKGPRGQLHSVRLTLFGDSFGTVALLPEVYDPFKVHLASGGPSQVVVSLISESGP